MLLKDYKKLVKGKEKNISLRANELLKNDFRLNALEVLNRALSENGFAHPAFVCRNNNTANAVLFYCDKKAN